MGFLNQMAFFEKDVRLYNTRVHRTYADILGRLNDSLIKSRQVG